MTNFQTAIVNLFQGISSTFEHIALLDSTGELYQSGKILDSSGKLLVTGLKDDAIAKEFATVVNSWNKIEEYSTSSFAELNNYLYAKRMQYLIVAQILDFQNAQRNLSSSPDAKDYCPNIEGPNQKAALYEEDKVNQLKKIKELSSELANKIDPTLYSEIMKPVYILIPDFEELYQAIN
jgi:hypothetical protein